MTAPFTRLSTALADRYRLERELGQGGMATVYLAEDLKHGRKIAIKVLHPELSAILGGERFLAEIRTTASLQHPHILGLIDSGVADGLLYYVMPFVEGESLRARLLREKQLPVEDALRLAREAASALEYAHKRGIVHRDIKPENILLQDGQALVADFGIALAVQQAGGSRMTQTGMSLGTPAYMSPEQAMGEREIGPRSDVYALGATTFEMLAGEPPFNGPNSQAIVAKVLTEEPPRLRTRRPMVSPAVEDAIFTALQKLPADRWGTPREFADALVNDRVASRAAGLSRTRPMAAAARPAGRWKGAALLAGALAVTALGAAAWMAVRPRPSLPPSRLAILTPGLGGSGASSTQRQVAFMPGGHTLVYTLLGTDGAARLVRQGLDEENPTPIPGTTGMGTPIISPDGRILIATNLVRNQAFRMQLDGSTPLAIARNAVLNTVDGACAPDGRLWFTGGEANLTPIGEIEGDSFRIHTRGVNPGRLLQMIDNHTAMVVQNRLGNATGPLTLIDVRTGKEQPFLNTSVVTGHVASGYLLYVSGNGALQAVPYDARSRSVGGQPVTLATNVAVTGTAVAQFTVADNGNLAFIPEEPYSLVFVDRSGAMRPVTGERHNFHHPLFSPDGERLLTDFTTETGRNVWLFDLRDGTLSRATFDRDGHDGTWSPDGSLITYTAPKAGAGQQELVLLRKPPGSAEPAETLLANPSLAYTGVWLRDGSAMLTTGLNLRRTSPSDSQQAETRSDLAINLNGGRGPLQPILASSFSEQYISASPDGKWIAFASDQSGRDEVYVRSLAPGGEQLLVSLEGGVEPIWNPRGGEVFYRETRAANARLVAARIETTSRLRVASRTPLFPIDDIVGTNPHANYDVSPDGTTFVLVRRSPSARIVVIQNFPALIRKLQGKNAR